jgi:DNA-binding transcriptional MerR regulator
VGTMTEKKRVHGKLYTMKETCEQTEMSYETLKFYCNKGLVPHVKRDAINRRVFDKKDIGWIKSLVCLKNCDMTLSEMKEYLDLCLQGPSSIPQRRVMLNKKRALLVQKLADVQAAIDFIDWKQKFYTDVEEGKTKYVSNLLP